MQLGSEPINPDAIALIKTVTGKVTQLFITFTAVVLGSSLKLNY